MTKPGVWFWVAGVLFLLWNLMGCGAYLAEVTMDDAAYAARYGEGVAALRDSIPVWSVAGYATAVWGGLLASLLFLLRRALAYPVFIVSLIGAVLGFVPLFIVPGMMDAMGGFDLAMPALVLVVGIIEIVASKRAKARGILR